ncbi:hypothetical protein SAMN05660776_2604 [Salegentibacter holothuriorum]|uniref:Lipoprotein n=1 Tax=Salegentibacter holothuriorum TaxID=241145 RepID=A0A1T5DG16_9FLAO|nr:hypothetical protein [Salegentibacter holothuriorum]SKB70675.1 hypothetical protein SAMN05660776_2604 [Salegentibacter holothuriorum]
MKNKKIILLIGLALILFSSCKSDPFSKTDKNIAAAISEIKTLTECRKIEYKFIGNPSTESKEGSLSTIKVELFDVSKPIEDYESFGKGCAKIIFNASEETKNYSKVWISFVSNGEKKNSVIGIDINISKEVRNFVYNSSNL